MLRCRGVARCNNLAAKNTVRRLSKALGLCAQPDEDQDEDQDEHQSWIAAERPDRPEPNPDRSNRSAWVGHARFQKGYVCNDLETEQF